MLKGMLTFLLFGLLSRSRYKFLRLVRLVKFMNMLEDWTAVSPAMFAFAMTVVKVPTYLSI